MGGTPPWLEPAVQRFAIIARHLSPTPWTVCGWLAVPYLLSTLALCAAGIPVPLPWRFLLHAIGMVLPYAYCLGRGILALHTGLSRSPRLVLVVGLLLGAALLWVGVSLPLVTQPIVFLLFAGLLFHDTRRLQMPYLWSLTGTLMSLTVGLGIVWNVNYLLVPRLVAFLHDPALMELDLAFYQWVFGRPVNYRNLFPLLDSPAVFRVMENAYHTIFVETLAVLLALHWTRGNPARFLRTVFLCYLIALVVFYTYPAVGPCIYYPATFRVEYEPTMTSQLMRKLADEFGAAVQGGPTDGFAYFIAIPSLHAALALLCQWALAGSKLIFWTFLPVNVGVILSTVLLGYHYVIDIPLGLLLAVAVIFCVPQTTAPGHDRSAAWWRRHGWMPAG